MPSHPITVKPPPGNIFSLNACAGAFAAVGEAVGFSGRTNGAMLDEFLDARRSARADLLARLEAVLAAEPLLRPFGLISAEDLAVETPERVAEDALYWRENLHEFEAGLAFCAMLLKCRSINYAAGAPTPTD